MPVTVEKHSCSTVKLRIPNDILLGETAGLLAQGESVILKAVGNSMLPFIRGGKDNVLLSPPFHVERGQIALVCLPDGRYILHRIIRIKGENITLMGDGNIRQIEHCTLSDIKGIVTRVIHAKGETDCTSPAERLKARTWFLLRPIRRYLLFICKHLWNTN